MLQSEYCSHVDGAPFAVQVVICGPYSLCRRHPEVLTSKAALVTQQIHSKNPDP